MTGQPPESPEPSATFTTERLGPYVLIRELASGELFTSHLARAPLREGPAQSVVIKRLRRQHARASDARAALEAEARTGAAVRSPHVVRALALEGSDEPYCVLEHVDGTDLGTLLRSAAGRAESYRLIVPVFVDALRGLGALHATRSGEERGSIHQAPVPRHIVVGRDGKARIIDLTLTGRDAACAAFAQRRLRPAEMAPEQALAPAHLDARCDVFIVGAALWGALTGRALFTGPDADSTLRSMLRAPIPRPSEANAPVGTCLDGVCLRALARPRHERYASALEMASELEQTARLDGIFAEPDEVGAWVASVLAGGWRPTVVVRKSSSLHVTQLGLGPPSPVVTSSPHERMRTLVGAVAWSATQPPSDRAGQPARSSLPPLADGDHAASRALPAAEMFATPDTTPRSGARQWATWCAAAIVVGAALAALSHFTREASASPSGPTRPPSAQQAPSRSASAARANAEGVLQSDDCAAEAERPRSCTQPAAAARALPTSEGERVLH